MQSMKRHSVRCFSMFSFAAWKTRVSELRQGTFYLPASTFRKAKHEIFSGDTFYVDRTHFFIQVKRQESSTISGGLRASPRTKIFFNFSGRNSPVLNPPLAAPDLMPSAANGAQKSQKLSDFYLSA